MSVEPGPAVVRVHVEGMLSQAGDVRAEDLAAEGEDEPIVGKASLPAGGCHGGGLSRQVDARDLPFHALDPDRGENVVEGDRTGVRSAS